MQLNGIYRGFSPTDESGVVLGELEVTIDDEQVAFRFATGLEIVSDSAERSFLRQLTAEELIKYFEPDTDLTGAEGHVIGDDGPVFLFLAEAPEAPEVPLVILLRFVSDEVDAVFGPSCLFTPEQVSAGLFDEMVLTIETEQGDPGVLPRLANDGRRG